MRASKLKLLLEINISTPDFLMHLVYLLIQKGVLLINHLLKCGLSLIGKFLLVFLCSQSLLAKEPLNIVVDVWPPYVMLDEEELTGADVEITKAVFEKMNIPITLELMPWKRCLSMVKNKQADAILDASITSERKEFLYFPNEPISRGITVLFKHKQRHFPFTGLQDLDNLKVGAISGYSYCDEIDKAPFFKHVERVTSLDQNFKKLLLGRIDALIEVDSVGAFTAKSMGILDQVEIIPNASYCHSGSYLAFSKKSGHELLSIKFSHALSQFKKTDRYRQILNKYGAAL